MDEHAEFNMWGSGAVPSDDYVEKIGELFGDILELLDKELREQELIAENSFFAATLIVKMEQKRGGFPVGAIVSFPDQPLISRVLIEQALQHLGQMNKGNGNGER